MHLHLSGLRGRQRRRGGGKLSPPWTPSPGWPRPCEAQPERSRPHLPPRPLSPPTSSSRQPSRPRLGAPTRASPSSPSLPTPVFPRPQSPSLRRIATSFMAPVGRLRSSPRPRGFLGAKGPPPRSTYCTCRATGRREPGGWKQGVGNRGATGTWQEAWGRWRSTSAALFSALPAPELADFSLHQVSLGLKDLSSLSSTHHCPSGNQPHLSTPSALPSPPLPPSHQKCCGSQVLEFQESPNHPHTPHPAGHPRLPPQHLSPEPAAHPPQP